MPWALVDIAALQRIPTFEYPLTRTPDSFLVDQFLPTGTSVPLGGPDILHDVHLPVDRPVFALF